MAQITINDFAKKAYKKYTDAGMTPAGACGLMGNQYAESAGFLSNRLEFLCVKRLKENGKIYTDETYTSAVDSGRITKSEFLNPLPNKQYGFGLSQWTSPSRKSKLYEMTVECGKSISDEDTQLEFTIKEMKETYVSVWNVLKTAKTVKEASDIVLVKYECPADTGSVMKNTRADYGQQYYNYFVANKNNKKDANLDMTVNEYIQKVIDIAEAEIGYLEKKSNKNLDNKTANVGSANYTKYGRDMHNLYPAVMDFPAAWCDAFVDWCFYKAYGVSTAKSLLCGNFDDYTVTSAQLYKNKGSWYKTPKKGDQIFFTNASGGICHTGLVVKVTSTQVITIEGNTSSTSGVVANGGCVRKKTYSLSYSRIAGYGRPAYEKFCKNGVVNNNTVTNPSVTTSTTKLNETKKWEGIVTADSLNVRTWAGSKNPVCSFSPLKKNTEVHVCDSVKASDGSIWYYIKYNKKYGFVHSDYIKEKKKKETSLTLESAKYKDSKLAGTYKTTSKLNMRYVAGKLTKDNIICVIPKNKKVQCYGYYNVINGTKWYLVVYDSKTGFVSSKYLKK